MTTMAESPSADDGTVPVAAECWVKGIAMSRTNSRCPQVVAVSVVGLTAAVALLAAGVDFVMGDDGSLRGSPTVSSRAHLATELTAVGDCRFAEEKDEEPETFETRLFVAEILFIQPNLKAQRFQIFALDPDTTLPPKVLPVHDPLRHYADIAYSPDGKKIVFSCQKRLPR